MKQFKKTLAASLLLSIFHLAYAYADENVVPYPDGYRSWNHVKSMVIQSGHPLAATDQGIHHIYANAEAMKGLKSGRYPDGAILVYDLLEYIEKDKTIQEGERKLVGVMYKNSKGFSKTGGWGFDGFAGNSNEKRLVKDNGKSCFSCHLPKKENGYVFSELRK